MRRASAYEQLDDPPQFDTTLILVPEGAADATVDPSAPARASARLPA